MEKKRRFSVLLAMLLSAALLTMMPTAWADDGLAWMDEFCSGDIDGVHLIQWEDVPGDCTHDWISTVYCSRCGKSHTERDPAPGHQWDDGKVTKEPTCTEAGERTYTCTRLLTNIACGAKRTETIPALGHDPEIIPGKAATCTESGLTEGSRCRRCGATLEAQETIPALGHSPKVAAGKAATCTESGLTESSICERCGATLQTQETIPALGHSPKAVAGKAATCTESGLTEGSVCERCGATLKAQETIPALGHSPKAVAGKAATCTESGMTEGSVCERCGATLKAQETIPALGHSPRAVAGKAATCTESGLAEESICERCGVTLKGQQTIPALGHSWDGGAVTQAATCTSDGVKTYTCTRCGTTRTEVIPAAGHISQVIPGTAATCTEGGLTEGSKCSVCGTVLTAQQSIAALGHDWDGGVVTKAATTTEEGVRTFTCRRNPSHTKTEAIPKLAPDAPPPTAHEHSWSEWMNDKGVHPSCIQREMQYRTCSGCGESEYRYGSYGDHDWGDWHVSKEPAATESGTEERICKIDASHREEREIPATGEPEATGTLIVTKIAGDTKQPLAGAHFRVDGPDVMDEWISTAEPYTVKGLTVNEVYTLVEVGAPEGYKTADSITFKIGDTNPLSLTVVDEKEGIHPSLSLIASWAPDAGKGKAYVGAELEYTLTKTNTGDCPLIWRYLNSRVVSCIGPNGPVAVGEEITLEPGQSVTSVLHKIVSQSDVDDLICSFKVGNNARYIAANGEERYVHGSCPVEIPLTYPDGEEPEDKKAELTLTYLYDNLVKDVYDPEDIVYAASLLINTGNVPLKLVIHYTDGVWEYDAERRKIFDPGKSDIDGRGPWKIKYGITPGTETEDLLGTVTIHTYFTGHDPDTGEELCRSETVTRTWKVGKPGVTPWPIPEESEIYGELTNGVSSSFAGYGLGEISVVGLKIQNTGKVTIPADGITFNDPNNGQTFSVFSSDFKPGESGIAFAWIHVITEEDVKNGYIYYPPVQLTWTDPDSGNPRTVYTNSLTLNVNNRTGLLLRKDIGNGPENGSYYREGEPIPWTLTVTNNSREPVRNVTVTDQGVTVGTFPEIAAGETVTCNVPPYVVTEYDAYVGSVGNYATATGEDLRGTVHTWNSNTAVAPTNDFGSPLPPEDGKESEPKEDPGDPMGLIYGLKVGATVYKEEDGGPLNGSYYELDEEIRFTITVKNTGEVPLENVQVTDSLNGFAPIGTAASIAPGAEASFTFTHQVTQPDIDAGWVTNSATVTYTFDGGKPGSPVQSNLAKVKAGEGNGLITGGGGGHFTPIPPTTPAGDPLEPVTLPDGTPLMTPDGTPIIAPPGTVPVIGPDGKPVTAPGGMFTGPDGVPVSIPAGTPVLKLPDGTYCVIGSDGRAILTDANGNPILDENGFVIFLGWSIGPFNCELKLECLGENEARYTLHACSEHTGAAVNAETAGQAGDWAGAAAIWREETEKMYELFLEAADDEGKAALVQERAAFLAYADAWQALAGDEAAAELLRLKTAQMCCIIHTLPEELPNSIIGAIEFHDGKAYEATLREIGALNGSDSEVSEQYAGAAARTLTDIRNMLDAAKSYNFDEVFARGQRNWQIALDNTVNSVYKAADKETRRLIITWRTALDTLYTAETTLMEMLYPENDTAAQEELMNLYRDRVFDAVKIK